MCLPFNIRKTRKARTTASINEPLNKPHLQDFIYTYLKNEYSPCSRHHGTKTTYCSSEPFGARKVPLQTGRVMPAEPWRWYRLGSDLQRQDASMGSTASSSRDVGILRGMFEYDLLSRPAQQFLEATIKLFSMEGHFHRLQTELIVAKLWGRLAERVRIAAELVAVFFRDVRNLDSISIDDKAARRAYSVQKWVDEFAGQHFSELLSAHSWRHPTFGERLIRRMGLNSRGQVCQSARRDLLVIEVSRLARRMAQVNARAPRRRRGCPYCRAGVEHDGCEDELPVYEEDSGLPSYSEVDPSVV